jgi:hypothetical protein
MEEILEHSKKASSIVKIISKTAMMEGKDLTFVQNEGYGYRISNNLILMTSKLYSQYIVACIKHNKMTWYFDLKCILSEDDYCVMEIIVI